MISIGEASYVGGPAPAFGPNDPAVELINNIAEFTMAWPALAIILVALLTAMVAVIFAGAGALMWYSIYISQRLYGWGPHGRPDREQNDSP